MAFSDYRNYDQVIEKYQLGFRRMDFIPTTEPPELDDRFRARIKQVWREFPFERSEGAASHALIFPILYEVWENYRQNLILLCQEPLKFDDDLSGVADFVLAKKSNANPTIPERPFLLVGEAKNDEFYRGWGQALSAMLAMAKRDGSPATTNYGIATNGVFWQFGKLENNEFTLDMRPFTPSNLDQLMAALHFVFAACRDQVVNLPAAA